MLTASAWELVLYDCMRATKNDLLAVPFILSFFILGFYIISNLFIGAILANMGSLDDRDRLQITKETAQKAEEVRRVAREAQLFVNVCQTKRKRKKKPPRYLTNLTALLKHPSCRETFIASPIERTRFGIEITNVALCWFTPDLETSPFRPEAPFRKVIYSLVTHPTFDLVILGVIAWSTILLTTMNYDTLNDDAWVDFFFVNDVIFLIVFTIEFVLKVCAFGLIWCVNIQFMLVSEVDLKKLMTGNHGRPAYMCDPWNYLDIIVLLISYVNLFLNPDGPFKIFRILRAFRPLRMINRLQGMKLVLGALMDALPALMNVLILLAAVFVIFGILGLSLFMGKFASCNDRLTEWNKGSHKETCYGHNTLNADNYWTPKVQSDCVVVCLLRPKSHVS